MRAIVLLLGIAILPTFAIAEPDGSPLSIPIGAMLTHGIARAPHGFVEFCRKHPAECEAEGPSLRMPLTSDRLIELESVNAEVNKAIHPLSDQDLYGNEEHWALPVDSGDCEDYALLKRKMLIQMGWPSSALLLTVVRDERGDGHALLTARTTMGDLILDNKQTDVVFWDEAGYHFVSRQSHLDPQSWVFVGEPDAEPAPSWVAKVNTVLADRMIELLPQ